jgi:dTDP-4-amino-4,6-dideoxygalactose transaminase
MSVYKRARADTKVTDSVGKRIVTIPIHANLNDDDVSHVIDSVNSFS